MHDTEIEYNFENIFDAINELKALQNRAIACSNMKYEMQESAGASKTALIETFDAMADLSASVATMLGGIINQLKYAKTHIQQEDELLSRKISN
jgi:hypothetical protein